MGIKNLELVLQEVRTSLDCPIILVLGRDNATKIPEFGIFPMNPDDVVVMKTVRRLKQKLGLDQEMLFRNIFDARIYKSVTPGNRKDLIPIVQSTLLEVEEELVFYKKIRSLHTEIQK